MDTYQDPDDSLRHSENFLNPKFKEPEIEYQSKHERCKSKARKLIHSKAFHITIVVLCVLDGLLVIAMLMLEIETLKLAAGPLRSRFVMASFVLECISLTIVTLFLLEIPLKVWVLGMSFYCKHWIELLDLTVCVVSFAVDVYNIQRHIEHEKHENKIQKHEPMTTTPNPNAEQQTMHETIADVAGLLVLFRLWRVVRIVNAILVTVSESHESQVRRMKRAQELSDARIHVLEQALWERGIPIPTLPKEEEHYHQHHHHQNLLHHSQDPNKQHRSLPHPNHLPKGDWIHQSKDNSIYENT